MPVGYSRPKVTILEPIHIAAKAGDNDEIKRLVSGGVNVDTETIYSKFNSSGNYNDNRGHTPVHLAFLSQHIDTARLLIDMGADIHRLNGVDTWEQQSRSADFNDNYMDSFGKTNGGLMKESFVDMVVIRGSFAWVKLLEEKSIFVHGSTFTERISSKAYGLGPITAEVLEYFLSRGADVHYKWDTKDNYNANKIHPKNMFNIHGGKPDTLRVLLSYGLNPDKRDFYVYDNVTSFRGSIQSRLGDRFSRMSREERENHSELLRVLDEPVERKYPSFSPGTSDSVRDRYDKESKDFDSMTFGIYDITESDGTPLHKAAGNSDVEEIKQLLDGGADINATDKFGNNVLHTILLRRFGGKIGELAKRRQHERVVEAIELMLENSIDIDQKNKYGRSPLYYAATYDNKIFSYLIEQGADIHMLDNKHGTVGDILEILRNSIETSKECESEKVDMEEHLDDMRTEVSEIVSKMATIDGKSRSLNETNHRLKQTIEESGSNLLKCIDRQHEIERLLRQSEALLGTRNRAIRACEEQKSELEHDVAMISARLVVEKSELSDDIVEARDRLRLSLEAAALNSNSVQLGSLIKDMTDFMNSGNMNHYQLAVMESIMEVNIRQATSPNTIELLRAIFVKIKDEVRDRETSISIFKELESKEFTVKFFTKMGALVRF